MDFENAKIDKKLLSDVVDNIENNKIIINYYEKFSKECSVAFDSDLIKKKALRISDCNKFWSLDLYKKSKVKDFRKTILCHDKFCSNCKKVTQAGRMARYIPQLEAYKDNMYHLVLTVPNCEGAELRNTIKNMSKSFKKLINYLTGHQKINGIDFSSWNYKGAVRSLEVTFKNYNSYHPHFHVGILLDNLELKKDKINKFAFDFRGGEMTLKALFSDEEILIQKIWYLLINNKKVTKKAIDDLPEGYSCMINKFNDNDYAELFKYITKSTDEKGNILTYEHFVNLYYGLYRIKQIQGYGVLFNISDDSDLEGLEEAYNNYIQALRNIEAPEVIYQRPQELLNDTEYMLLSRKTYFKYLKTI